MGAAVLHGTGRSTVYTELPIRIPTDVSRPTASAFLCHGTAILLGLHGNSSGGVCQGEECRIEGQGTKHVHSMTIPLFGEWTISIPLRPFPPMGLIYHHICPWVAEPLILSSSWTSCLTPFMTRHSISSLMSESNISETSNTQ